MSPSLAKIILTPLGFNCIKPSLSSSILAGLLCFEAIGKANPLVYTNDKLDFIIFFCSRRNRLLG
jgi:hypothetical protein